MSTLFRLLVTRSLRKAVCRLLIGVFAFAQVTIAAYACPAPSSAALPDVTVVAMPDCHHVDPDAANLCLEHCRFGQQSADHSPSPAPTPALLTLLYSVPVDAPALDEPPLAPDTTLAATSPPHAILHCCLRT